MLNLLEFANLLYNNLSSCPEFKTPADYDQKVEVNIPRKSIQMERFQRLANQIGKEKVIWRYDPIFFNEYYDFEYHKKWF